MQDYFKNNVIKRIKKNIFLFATMSHTDSVLFEQEFHGSNLKHSKSQKPKNTNTRPNIKTQFSDFFTHSSEKKIIINKKYYIPKLKWAEKRKKKKISQKCKLNTIGKVKEKLVY